MEDSVDPTHRELIDIWVGKLGNVNQLYKILKSTGSYIAGNGLYNILSTSYSDLLATDYKSSAVEIYANKEAAKLLLVHPLPYRSCYGKRMNDEGRVLLKNGIFGTVLGDGFIIHITNDPYKTIQNMIINHSQVYFDGEVIHKEILDRPLQFNEFYLEDYLSFNTYINSQIKYFLDRSVKLTIDVTPRHIGRKLAYTGLNVEYYSKGITIFIIDEICKQILPTVTNRELSFFEINTLVSSTDDDGFDELKGILSRMKKQFLPEVYAGNLDTYLATMFYGAYKDVYDAYKNDASRPYVNEIYQRYSIQHFDSPIEDLIRTIKVLYPSFQMIEMGEELRASAFRVRGDSGKFLRMKTKGKLLPIVFDRAIYEQKEELEIVGYTTNLLDKEVDASEFKREWHPLMDEVVKLYAALGYRIHISPSLRMYKEDSLIYGNKLKINRLLEISKVKDRYDEIISSGDDSRTLKNLEFFTKPSDQQIEDFKYDEIKYDKCMDMESLSFYDINAYLNGEAVMAYSEEDLDGKREEVEDYAIEPVPPEVARKRLVFFVASDERASIIKPYCYNLDLLEKDLATRIYSDTCTEDGSYRNINKGFSNPLFRLAFETPINVRLSKLLKALYQTKNQAFLLIPTEEVVPRTASLSTYLHQLGVSGDHCQAGTDKRVYRIVVCGKGSDKCYPLRGDIQFRPDSSVDTRERDDDYSKYVSRFEEDMLIGRLEQDNTVFGDELL